MMHVVKRAWSSMLLPILKRPKRIQVAALCYRDVGDGRQVLLITSRDTGRWILPKGWPIDGLDSPGAALQEAWEEAGVVDAEIAESALGCYEYAKGLGEGLTVMVITHVFLTKVSRLSDDYPEAAERKRAWFTPAEAASRVDEPELKVILRNV